MIVPRRVLCSEARPLSSMRLGPKMSPLNSKPGRLALRLVAGLGSALAVAACAPEAHAPATVPSRTLAQAVTPPLVPTHPPPTETTLSASPTSHRSTVRSQQVADRGASYAIWRPGQDRLVFKPISGLDEPAQPWLEYDAFVGTVGDTEQPVKYDSQVWFRLGLKAFVAMNYSQHAESLGIVSPSGNYVIYTVDIGPESFFAEGAGTEVWLASTDARVKRLIVKTSRLNLYKAQWAPKDSKVVFGLYSPEGYYHEDYLADVRNGGVASISDVVDSRSGQHPYEWALSPDGQSLAFTDSKCRLHIASMAGKESIIVDSPVSSPDWSQSGAALYFWKISEVQCDFREDQSPCDLASFSLEDASLQILIKGTDAPDRLAFGPYPYNFAVSPTGKFVAFWDPVLGGKVWVSSLVD